MSRHLAEMQREGRCCPVCGKKMPWYALSLNLWLDGHLPKCHAIGV